MSLIKLLITLKEVIWNKHIELQYPLKVRNLKNVILNDSKNKSGKVTLLDYIV